MLGFAGISSFAVSGQKVILGRENRISEAIAGICWDFSFFALSTATWQTARKKKIGVGEIIFLKLESGHCWDLLGFLLLRCRLLLGGLPGKKMIFGSGKSFF